MRLRVIDLDGVGEQAPLALRAHGVTPARDLAPGLRLWADRRSFEALRIRLGETALPGRGPSVTFMGSGDFHNLTPLLLAEVEGPLVVVHVDNHPDWVRAAPARHCGAWVNRALELAQVLKVITVGPTSADLDRPDVKGGAFRHLAAGRIEMFAWSRPPSPLVRRLADGPGHRVEGRRLVWRCVGEEDWAAFLDDLVARIPHDAGVWLTLDKDALRPEDAATNWDQGLMPLEALDALVRRVAEERRVVGVDVCGDWSPQRFSNPFKTLEARLDQPPATRRGPPGDLSVNARTNARLLETFEEVLQ